jgi:uncharacterized membrane protein
MSLAVLSPQQRAARSIGAASWLALLLLVVLWEWLLVLAYIAEGSVRAVDAPPAGTLAMIEIALGLAFFAAAIVYLRPFKKAARRRAGG